MVIMYRSAVLECTKYLHYAFRHYSSNDMLTRIRGMSSRYYSNIKIYNTSVKKKIKLTTKESGIISWYCCGPTVYDLSHIGHACCYIHFDVIRRIMEEVFHQNVIFLMNITDIDDKIIKKADMEGVDFRTIAKHFEEEFFKDMALLNVKNPNIIARVSDYIPDIIDFISKIISNDYGYVTADGSVNFSVNKYKNYGIFGRAQGECSDESSDKEQIKDFALWKRSKAGEPSWSSPWGEGRPGWHIECSAIASKFFGNQVDIHSGGIDLQFPHHENEEAQCCAYHNINCWVNHWMHTGHVHLKDSVKMSKSLKNTISIEDFLSKYDPNHLRMLCLMIPYRNSIEYGDDVMENAVAVLDKFKNFINDCNAYISGTKPLSNFDEAALFQSLEETRKHVLNCLADDFDTSSAVSRIIQFITKANIAFSQQKNILAGNSYLGVAAANAFVNNFLSTCGFKLSDSVVGDDKTSDIRSILETSLQLRSKIRDIALKIDKSSPEVVDIKSSLLGACDQFRNEMSISGIELKDYGKTTSWNFTDKIKNKRKS